MESDSEHPARGEPFWSSQCGSHPLSVAARARNRADLDLIDACLPDPEVDVNHHAARLSIRTGLGRGQCLALCDIGLLLQQLPALRQVIERTLSFSLPHLRAISTGVVGLNPEQLHAAEPHLVALLTPTRPNQAVIGVRRLSRLIGDLVAEYDDRARNDGTERAPKSEGVSLADAGDGAHSFVTAVLERDRATELLATIEGIRNLEISRGNECTQAEALMKLARGSSTAEIVINVFRDASGGPAWIDGAGWLSEVATEEWIRRATHIRLSSDSTVEGYRPSESQAARVRGRHGTCRFPGCDVPAHKCDLDHIQPYNHDHPELGGPTDTQNLHCLCRRHHNLKTHEGWNIDRHPDGSEVWTSRDGDSATSVPTGPLKNVGKQTFSKRATRKIKTIRQRHMDWLLSFCEPVVKHFELTEADEKRIESLTDEELDAEIDRYLEGMEGKDLLDGD